MGCFSSKPKVHEPDHNGQYNDPYAAGTPPKPHQDNAHVQPVPQKHTVPEPVPQTTDTAVNKGAVPNTADLGEPENLLYKDPIHHSSKSTTQVIMSYGESVLNERPGPKYKAVKTLGKGGFGVVTLCERLGRDPERRLPPKFALKELISPKVFPLGKNENIRDYLPLNEAAIQRYMRHSSIVETYWADVRCLHPETNEPLDVGVSELAGAWTPLDNLNDLEKTYEAAEQRHPGSLPYKEVKLQMRIAMEHCDLGSIKDYLVDNPERQGTRTLVEMLRLKRRMSISIDPTLCALLTSLDIAEALKFMHKSKTLHGDLKPHNILLVSTPQGDDIKGFRAKISDFGLSQHMTKDQNYVLVSKGTEAYLPVEVFQNLALTEKSDVYAMGLLMWEIFYGIFWHAIYEEEKKRKGVKRPIDMGDYHPSCNSYCPEKFAAIVHQCVRRDPNSRPTAADIVTALNGVISELSRTSNAQAQAHVSQSSGAPPPAQSSVPSLQAQSAGPDRSRMRSSNGMR